MTQYTLDLIESIDEALEDQIASHYYPKIKAICGKYLRKFAFDNMIDLEIPESIADFIEGRVPVKIGAKHYMALVRRADQIIPDTPSTWQRLDLKAASINRTPYYFMRDFHSQNRYPPVFFCVKI